MIEAVETCASIRQREGCLLSSRVALHVHITQPFGPKSSERFLFHFSIMTLGNQVEGHYGSRGFQISIPAG